MSSGNTASLPYHEPGIVTILIISSFLLLLNAVNYILNRLVYCGLVGQLFIGVGWGTPGADWLSAELQQSIVQLGYLGLILIVYEGGLASNLKALKANLFLSSAVALTGLSAPIGISFVLPSLLPLSPVQAFAAGAALCSTSLGTTFTVLATSGLTESRLGVILTSAAMMDDVVGLIMVQIISSLGAGSSLTAATVIRPVFVSLAFAVLIPLICRFVAKPAMQGAYDRLQRPENARYRAICYSPKAALACQTGVLLAMITSATYAGTSNLFAAYLAGASVTWLSDCVVINEHERPSCTGPTTSQASSQASGRSQSGRAQTATPGTSPTTPVNNAVAGTDEHANGCSGKEVYERYYSPVVESVFRPLFFASIGFAIPITRMFSGRVIWRGFVYTILMIFAKLICGLWLVRFAPLPRAKAISRALQLVKLPSRRAKGVSQDGAASEDSPQTKQTPASHQRPEAAVMRQSSSSLRTSPTSQPNRDTAGSGSSQPTTGSTANMTRKRAALPKPKSLYPAAILGSAMVSRGEIGFLISSVAESVGVFGEGGNTEEFLIVTWAILLCTLIGPVTVGLLVKRVKRLQQAERRTASGQEDPLGVWGVMVVSDKS
ncbi:hypothetical protein LTR62_004506 [Meristemomyces frigidus]|uniref:Cation/H+ exchanger transmembrane domain-containing protein n=1 Tax=Meristemomyces frigidus TaxID=1508187 RepID=A0AAN7TEI9_9PEZI|nr:hypothetical protein LTR62_004506 [Meristemomyces frigidus]